MILISLAGPSVSVPGYLLLTPSVDFIISDSQTAKVGEGGSASIFAGKMRNVRRVLENGIVDIAVKVNSSDCDVSSFYYELALMSSLPKSPFVVKLMGYSETPIRAIVMKLYDGSLAKFLHSDDASTVKPELALKFARDIAQGLQVIHKSSIVHLDLKPGKP